MKMRKIFKTGKSACIIATRQHLYTTVLLPLCYVKEHEEGGRVVYIEYYSSYREVLEFESQ